MRITILRMQNALCALRRGAGNLHGCYYPGLAFHLRKTGCHSDKQPN